MCKTTRTCRLILFWTVLAAAGCTRQSEAPVTDLHTSDPGRLEAEFMAADRQFAAEVATAGPEARATVWAGWFAGDGRQLIPRQVVQGSAKITDLMGPAFATPGYSLQWEPDLASVSAAGDLGWTSGRYVSSHAGPEGPVTTEGRYLTVWRRQPDGLLKVELDTGVPD
jgi:hypothetical protein